MPIENAIARGMPDLGAGVMPSVYAAQQNQRRNAFIDQQTANMRQTYDTNANNAIASDQAQQERAHMQGIVDLYTQTGGAGPQFEAGVRGMGLPPEAVAGVLTNPQGAFEAAMQRLNPGEFGKQYFKNQYPTAAPAVADPSSSREWAIFNKMSAADQAAYLNMKRAGKIYDVGGVPNELTPGGATRPLTTLEEVSGNRAKTAGETASATATGKGASERDQLTIDEGKGAAGGIVTIRRAIELLGEVETGGYDAVALKAKQVFGIESANEAELNSAMAEAVLGDLRRTFGAQFTEKEGARLTSIRSNFGKSSAANKRLLTQALKIAEASANRGMDRARKNGDLDTVKEIQDMMSMQLDSSPANEGPAGNSLDERLKAHGID